MMSLALLGKAVRSIGSYNLTSSGSGLLACLFVEKAGVGVAHYLPCLASHILGFQCFFNDLPKVLGNGFIYDVKLSVVPTIRRNAHFLDPALVHIGIEIVSGRDSFAYVFRFDSPISESCLVLMCCR